MGADNSLDDRQSQATTREFCSEEGIEDLSLFFFGHPLAGIRDPQQKIVTLRQFGRTAETRVAVAANTRCTDTYSFAGLDPNKDGPSDEVQRKSWLTGQSVLIFGSVGNAPSSSAI